MVIRREGLAPWPAANATDYQRILGCDPRVSGSGARVQGAGIAWRAVKQFGDRSQARSAVFAVSDDVEEHPPECLQLALAEAVQDRCLDAVAGAGHFCAQGVSCLGDFRDSRA